MLCSALPLKRLPNVSIGALSLNLLPRVLISHLEVEIALHWRRVSRDVDEDQQLYSASLVLLGSMARPPNGEWGCSNANLGPVDPPCASVSVVSQDSYIRQVCLAGIPAYGYKGEPYIYCWLRAL
jgi:hypothetical protein